MTAQEAIKFLKETAAGCKFTRDKQLLNVCNVSIESLEKQIPKKPIVDYEYICQCGGVLYEGGQAFCNECGQALDWSE